MEKQPVYLCLVNGQVGSFGKIIGMCGKIGCGTNVCHSDKDCRYKSLKESITETPPKGNNDGE